jgi:DNA-directed RNA polymerase subunit beta
MVEDKIHQRSIGPFLITSSRSAVRRSLAVSDSVKWKSEALEGYGVPITLQEMLTIKSDDVPGRSKSYETIIKGEEIEK